MCERGLVKAPLSTNFRWKPMMRWTVSSRDGVSMIFQRLRLRKLTSRMSRLSVGAVAGEIVDPGDDAALELDVVVERHRHARFVGAFAHLIAPVEIQQRLV